MSPVAIRRLVKVSVILFPGYQHRENTLVVTLLPNGWQYRNYQNVPPAVRALATACNSRITQNSRRAET